MYANDWQQTGRCFPYLKGMKVGNLHQFITVAHQGKHASASGLASIVKMSAVIRQCVARHKLNINPTSNRSALSTLRFIEEAFDELHCW